MKTGNLKVIIQLSQKLQKRMKMILMVSLSIKSKNISALSKDKKILKI